MVNVNVQLPPVIAAPFPQASEAIHRENTLQPAIPKTEKSQAYSKARDHQERENVAHQSSQIVQKETHHGQAQEQSSRFNQRREQFFATKLKLSPQEMDQTNPQLSGISDYKEVVSVIQKKYSDAVSPIPEPSVNYHI